MKLEDITNLIRKDVYEKDNGIEAARNNTTLLFAYSNEFYHYFCFKLEEEFYVFKLSFDYNDRLSSSIQSFSSFQEMTKFIGKEFWHNHNFSILDISDSDLENIKKGNMKEYFISPEFEKFIENLEDFK
jgi:hypothetical protein